MRSTKRFTCIPHVCTLSRGKRSWLKGILSSAVHPSESMRASARYTGSHEGSALADAWPASFLTPDGLTRNAVTPVWSWYVSKMNCT
jgi:hypothetical protein